LVQQVERARTREEQREQERDRTERLLAARQEREPRHLLAGRTELDLDPGLALFVLRLGQPQPALTAREERGGNLGEVRLHGSEGAGEALRTRAPQVVAQLLEFFRARLQVGALPRQLGEPLLLLVVLLLRERVHLSERVAAALEPFD